MSATATFSCDGCKKKYVFKPELAGKKVRCKCGAVIAVPRPSVPKPAPVAADPDDMALDDLYALSGDNPNAKISNNVRCPDCQTEAAPGSVLCVNCGMNFATGQRVGMAAPATPVLAMAGGGGAVAAPRTLGYAGKKGAVANEKASNDARAEMMMLVPPAIVVVIGIIATLFYAVVAIKLNFAMASIYVAVTTAINTIMIAIGLFLAMKMLDFSLGAPAQALLKVAAIAMLPGAVSNLIEYYGGPMGGFIGWGVSLLFYYILLMWFFELDGMEVYIVTAIFWLVRTWLGMAVTFIILSQVMNLGSAGGGTMAMVMGGGGGRTAMTTDPSMPAGRINQRASVMLMRIGSGKAKEWVDKSENRVVIGFDHAKTKQLIDDLYDAGAEEVSVSDVNKYGQIEQADKLVVELPEEPEARKTIVDLVNPSFKGREIGERKDFGEEQYYLILDYDGNDK